MSTDWAKQEKAHSRLLAHYKTTEDGKGEVWVPCPNCERADKKFSFSVRGFKCFVCGFSGKNLSYLAHFVSAPKSFTPYRHTKKPRKPERPQPWQSNPGKYLSQFTSHPDKERLWRTYRPFTDDIIKQYHLGVGVLPSCRCRHTRLIYPASHSTRIVGFRGRAIECDCPKWLVSKGTKVVLWTSDFLPYVEPGRIFLICESPIDGMLVKMVRPQIVVVSSTGGAGTWRDEWSDTISSMQPSSVLVWLDNDLPGGATGETRKRLLTEWYAKMDAKGRQNVRPPVANGIKIVNSLLSRGIPAKPYIWADDAPAKMDLSDFLMKGL